MSVDDVQSVPSVPSEPSVPSAPRSSAAVDFAPWHAMNGDADAELAANVERLAALRALGHTIDPEAYVARQAVVDADHLTLGARSYLAASTHVTGSVTIGSDCSVNLVTAVRGTVTIGDGVRIGASTSILGFDHGFADVETPIRHQPHTSRGIVIEDDVWIGAHVVVLDGVRIGAHSIVGAGAVVTRDVPAYAVAVGNPARVIRDRRTGSAPASPAPPAAPGLRAPAAARWASELGSLARRDVPGILAAAFDGVRYHDAPGSRPTVRAHCDALELADLVAQGEGGRESPDGVAHLGTHPAGLAVAEHVAWLRALQGPDGALREPGTAAAGDAQVGGRADAGHAVGQGVTSEEPSWPGGGEAYHVLCVGYALDLLGARLAAPLTPWLGVAANELPRALDALDWRDRSWGAGADVDTLGTALTWADEAGWTVPVGTREALVGWLVTHRDPDSGLWGTRRSEDGWRLPVNGTYRLVRGTLAQWGASVGGGREVVDTVLRHARGGILARDRVTACDALDVVHLLWWARRQGAEGYRTPEVAEVAAGVLAAARESWHDGAGLAFAPGGSDMVLVSGVDPGTASLQGTEMWLATAWYAADLLGVAGELRYTPRGIHRPYPRG